MKCLTRNLRFVPSFRMHYSFDNFLVLRENVYKMQSNINALIDLKLEKHKNLREEAAFFWKDISDGTFLFDRKESEVSCILVQ